MVYSVNASSGDAWTSVQCDELLVLAANSHTAYIKINSWNLEDLEIIIIIIIIILIFFIFLYGRLRFRLSVDGVFWMLFYEKLEDINRSISIRQY